MPLHWSNLLLQQCPRLPLVRCFMLKCWNGLAGWAGCPCPPPSLFSFPNYLCNFHLSVHALWHKLSTITQISSQVLSAPGSFELDYFAVQPCLRGLFQWEKVGTVAAGTLALLTEEGIKPGQKQSHSTPLLCCAAEKACPTADLRLPQPGARQLHPVL